MNTSFSEYTEELFKSISNEFKTIFDSIKHESTDIEINGVWPFLYLEGSNSLKSIEPVFLNEKVKMILSDEDEIELKKTVINCDYGSIGFAFKNVKNNTSGENYDILHKTFNEPRGVVCYLDSKIKQEHAIFIAIKDSHKKILGILDLFFNGEVDVASFKIFAKNLWNKFHNDNALNRLCVNTFIIQQFFELQQQSNNKQLEDSSSKPIKKIERILTLSSKTPILYFTYHGLPISDEYVGLNFETIYDFVAHEYRFCGFVKRDIECFYKKKKITKNLFCQNSLLTDYYYDIIKENFNSFRQECNISGSKYIVEVIIHNDNGDKVNILTKENTSAIETELTKELEQFKRDYKLNDDDFATNKFKDEIIFSFLKKKLAKAVVLILYREVRIPYLIYCGKHCNKDKDDISQIKEFISPSELLHYQYSSEEIDKQLIKRAGDGDKESEWNVVHFEILQKNVFIDSVKKRIANSPEKYGKSISPYLNNVPNGKAFKEDKDIVKDYKYLKFYYIGKNPLKEGNSDYLSTIKEQISLIYSEFEAKETLKQALRAAIAQVFARNTSHNIGAHVMNKLIGDLNSLPLFNFSNNAEYNYQSAFEKDLKKLHKGVETKINDDNDLSSLTELQKEKVLIHRILLEQIALFNNYVKCRMDYLADISFGTPLMQTNKYAYGELFKDLDKVRLLLEHISGLSDFKYEIVFKKDGKPLNDTNDLLVAIPNDILGTQALYNILENIIRNTAKHSSTKPDITTFTVNFIDDIEKAGLKEADNKTEIANTLNEFIAVEVYDNIPIEKTDEDLNLTDEDKKEYKAKTEKDFDKFDTYIDKLVFKQNKKLNEDILQDNKLRSYSLGLVEMDASAAYLRKRPVEYINHPSYDIQYDESWSRDTELNGGNQEIRGTNCRHFLKAFKKENVVAEFTTVEDGTSTTKSKTGTALGYRLFLHRPAVVLVVTEELKNDKEKKDILRKEGIWVVDEATFREEIEDKKEGGKVIKAGKVYPHEFVVYTDYNIRTVIDEYKTSLPIRILKVEQNKVTELFNKTDDLLEEWEKFCWGKWYNGDKLNPKKEVDIMPKYVNSNSDNVVEAIFLDHIYSDTAGTPKDKWEKEIDAKHLEALSSLAQSKMPDFAKLTKGIENAKDKIKKYLELLNYNNVVTNKNNVVTHHKIADSVLTKVILIDERIQDTTKESNEGGSDFMTIPYKCLYAKMGVIVPEKSINLSENSFETINKPLEEYIEAEIRRAKSTDFILIHYSILERMYKKEDIKAQLDKWAESINVVVTSGRGTPDNLSEKVRFVNLSSVITAFVDVRSKYAINYLLNSSRKSNKI